MQCQWYWAMYSLLVFSCKAVDTIVDKMLASPVSYSSNNIFLLWYSTCCHWQSLIKYEILISQLCGNNGRNGAAISILAVISTVVWDKYFIFYFHRISFYSDLTICFPWLLRFVDTFGELLLCVGSIRWLKIFLWLLLELGIISCCNILLEIRRQATRFPLCQFIHRFITSSIIFWSFITCSMVYENLDRNIPHLWT